MNGPARSAVLFSEHASVSLFECLIVAGAPATGLLMDSTHGHGGVLQMSLQLLRNMWQRADSLYVPCADLERLHTMECTSAGRSGMPIPDLIVTDARKLSRYYIYLLFRYCMSTASGPLAIIRSTQHQAKPWGCLAQQDSNKVKMSPLGDVPQCWLQSNVCTNYPSAPPISQGTIASGTEASSSSSSSSSPHMFQQPYQLHYQPVQHQQQLQVQIRHPSSHQHHQRYQQQQHLGFRENLQNFTTHQDQQFPVQPCTKQRLYPDLKELPKNELPKPSRVKGSDGGDHRLRNRNTNYKGRYESNVESGED